MGKTMIPAVSLGGALPENVEEGVVFSSDNGLRQTGTKKAETVEDYPVTTAIDYSDYSSGKFVETLDDGSNVEYTLTLDSEGKPTKITDPNGNAVTVEW